MEVDIVMQGHGKIASSRFDAFNTFYDALRKAAIGPLPEWTLMPKAENTSCNESGHSNDIVEHTVTEESLRNAGFVEHALVRRATDLNPKTSNVWRINTLSVDGVTMIVELTNASRTLALDFAKFHASFILTPELEHEVLHDDEDTNDDDA